MTTHAAELLALEAEVLALVDAAKAYEHIDRTLQLSNKREGRPRVLNSRALLVGLHIASINGKYFIQEVPLILNGLSALTKRNLGIYGHTITWRQVQYLISRIDSSLRPRITNTSLDDAARYADFDAIFSVIATSGCHEAAKDSLSVAIDGSDIATWARIQWEHRNIDGHETPVKKITDVDAGVRPSKNEDNKKPFFGYELTLATAVADLDGPAVPKAAKAARFRPTSKADPRKVALSALSEVKERQGELGDVLVDRGYTSSNDGQAFIVPVRRLGGEPVFDLRDNQVGTSKTVHGAIIIDGRPYSPSIPKKLRNLEPPRSKGTKFYRPSPSSIAAYEKQIAAREVYAMVPHGKISDDLRLVMQCPGAAGKLSCPLQAPKVTPRPGILPINTNPKTVLAHSVCATRYKTFDLDTDIPLYQREVYGSEVWRKSYGRRGTGVEPHFGALKDESVAGFNRGKVRMRGIVKTGLMVAVAVATTNRRFAIAWDRLRGPFPKVSKRKLVKRKRYHHALTSITHTVNGQLVVLHPLTT